PAARPSPADGAAQWSTSRAGPAAARVRRCRWPRAPDGHGGLRAELLAQRRDDRPMQLLARHAGLFAAVVGAHPEFLGAVPVDLLAVPAALRRNQRLAADGAAVLPRSQRRRSAHGEAGQHVHALGDLRVTNQLALLAAEEARLRPVQAIVRGLPQLIRHDAQLRDVAPRPLLARNVAPSLGASAHDLAVGLLATVEVAHDQLADPGRLPAIHRHVLALALQLLDGGLAQAHRAGHALGVELFRNADVP